MACCLSACCERLRLLLGQVERRLGPLQGGFARLQLDLERLADRSDRAESPALTSLPCSNRRSTTMPDTRGRTSATRVGAMRPGSSRIRAKGSALTVTMPTSGGADWGASAEAGSSQAASSRINPSTQSGADVDDRKRIVLPNAYAHADTKPHGACTPMRLILKRFPDLLVVVEREVSTDIVARCGRGGRRRVTIGNCLSQTVTPRQSPRSRRAMRIESLDDDRRRRDAPAAERALAGGAIGRGV